MESSKVARITVFEVTPAADETFLAAWHGAPGSLLRALRDDVSFRLVAIAPPDSPQACDFPVHSGLYEVAHEDGAPDTEGGVVLVHAFEVPDGEDGAFLAGWHRARDVLARQRGYLGTRLHRSTGPADFRFVNVARWSSPLMFARTLQLPEFAQAAAAMPFPSHPALYQPAG